MWISFVCLETFNRYTQTMYFCITNEAFWHGLEISVCSSGIVVEQMLIICLSEDAIS